MDDYCVWVQQTKECNLQALADHVDSAVRNFKKEDIAWPLADLEEEAQQRGA